MKKLVLPALLCLVLTSTNILAQTATGGSNRVINKSQDDEKEERGELRTYKVKLGNSKEKQVNITMFNSGVRVIGHNSDEVILETRSFSPPPARAAGLKSLYNSAEDNTGMGISAVKENNTLVITKASRGSGNYTIRVPKNASVIYKEANWTGSNFNLQDVDGEIEVKLNNASASLTNVSGPVVVNTTNGSINVKFSGLNQAKPSAISTINGSIDITLPAATKADFKLHSMQGEIYTDFDMNQKKDTKSDLPKIAGSNKIEGKTNGGGVEMSLYTINSDIFIRKAK